MSKRNNRADYLICAALIVATLVVYWQAHAFGFVLIDDPMYVANNPNVLGGLTTRSMAWAFETLYLSNWHPLTWLSLMTDAQFGGGDPGVFHVTNVVLHVFNTLLLFAFLRLATGYRWRSAAVAALFALHPLHVESVAWISERKDVLSTLFWLLTMLAYLSYVRCRGVGRYLLVVALFAFGLMAKPMLVSLPIVLLLLDVWPLGRVSLKGERTAWWPLVREKIPLLAMCAASCVVTTVAQAGGGSLYGTQALPIGGRVANVLVAYVSYIAKMLWPLKLMPLYVHPGRNLPVWQTVGSGLLLAMAAVVAVMAVRRRPYVTVGWLWYVVTLVPVIGLVQVGTQAMADRYAYVPLIGLFVILAWGLPELAAAISSRLSPAWYVLEFAVFAGLMVATYFQVGYWRNSANLGDHALAVDSMSYAAHHLRGNAYAEEGRDDKAVAQYRESLAIAPYTVQPRLSLVQVLTRMGRLQESATECKRLLKMMPYNPQVQYEAGALLLKMGQFDRAIKHFGYALTLHYEQASLYISMGCAYAGKQNLAKARESFDKALSLDPSSQLAQSNLAWVEQQLSGGGRRPKLKTDNRGLIWDRQ